MGKRLVIAEKPMLAKAILDAIPGTAKSIKAGERVFYTEKGDYLVVALADEKIRAVHSGKYTAIRTDRLLDIVKGYFDREWPTATFEEGYFSHERMQEVIDLAQYKDDFFGHIPTGIFQSATPAFVVYSSDVATSAVTLVPSMKLGGVCVPMTKAVKIEHMGEDLEARVSDALAMILAYFQGAVADMQALENVEVKYGTNALKRLLKDGGMPKKCAWELCLYAESKPPLSRRFIPSNHEKGAFTMDHFPIITKEIQTNFEACVKKNVEPTLDYGLRTFRYQRWESFTTLDDLRAGVARYFTKSETPIVERLCDFSHKRFTDDVAQNSYRDFTATCARTYDLPNLPDICGYLGRACRCMDKEDGANTAICTDCPLARFAGTKEQ